MKKKLIAICGIILIVFFLLPIVWMVIISIKQDATQIKMFIDWFKPPYTLEIIQGILRDTMIVRWISNSLFVAFTSVILTLSVSSITAYAFSKLPLPGKKLLFSLLLIGLTIPFEAIALAQYEIARNLNLLNTLSVLIIPGIASPFAVLVLKNFIDTIPSEVMESAELEGASKMFIFFKIIVPLIKTPLATLSILLFLQNWNSFLWPFLTITDMRKFTVPVGIPTLMSSFNVDYIMPMAVSVIASFPGLILFLILEKQIAKGIALTGIKG